MKKAITMIMVAGFFALGFSLGKNKSAALVPEKKMMQVGIIVDDIEAAAKSWSDFLGLAKVPEISIASGHESRPTFYKGEPSEATAKLAFFELDNITIELIEPDGKPSTWQEFLDEHGPGMHHIAFNVDDMEISVKNFENFGIPEIQHGGWGSGEYSYMDASKNLALIVELLEHYNTK